MCLFIYFNSVHPLWYAKRWRGFDKYNFGRSMCFSWNAHNSWTAWYILIKFFILIQHNIIETHICKPVIRLCQTIFCGKAYSIFLQKSKWVWSGNTTITNRRQPCGIARKSRSTITRHQEDKLSKATSSLFPIKMIAILERTQSNIQQNI